MKDFKVYQASGYLTKLVTDASDVRKEYEEISGSLVQFDTPISAPLASLIVDINPVQDLNGQDAPYPPGGGVNLCPPLVGNSGYTGLTVTTNADGSLTVSGTATGSGYITEYENLPKTIVAGTPCVVSVKTALPVTLRAFFDSGVADIAAGNTAGGVTTLNVDATKIRLYLFTEADTSYNFTIYFQFEEGSSATPWKPYANICPITGWTGANIYHSGEDTSNPTVYPVSWQDEAGMVYGGMADVVNGVLTVDRLYYEVDGTTNYFTLAGNYANIGPYGVVDGINTSLLTWLCNTFITNTANVGYNAGAKFVYLNRTAWEKIGSTSEELNAYAAIHPIQFVFQLTDPITIQINPQEINTLIGVNNIWADTGDVSVKYRTH